MTEGAETRDKRSVRRQLRALRRALPTAERARASAVIVAHLLESPEVQTAGTIASFWPMLDLGEVDLRDAVHALEQRGTRLCYPAVAGDGAGERMLFRLTRGDGLVARPGRAFPEPPSDCEVARPGEVDVVLVPSLAVTEHGERLGQGMGFYDRALGQYAPRVSIAVVFEAQVQPMLPTEVHDVRVTHIATERGLRPVRAAAAT